MKQLFLWNRHIGSEYMTNEMTLEDWRSLYRQYPVAERISLQWTYDYINHISNVVKTLSGYFERFGELGIDVDHGNIKKLVPSDADIHDGKLVHIIEFETGAKTVFKPRAAQTDRLWKHFLSRLAAEAGYAPFQFPRWIETPAGTFFEFIRYLPVTSSLGFSQYFRRCGFMLAAVHILNGSDLHLENLIAMGDCPVIIDTETIVCELTGTGLSETVIRTNLLPFLAAEMTYFAKKDGFTGSNSTSQNLPFDKNGIQDGYRYRAELIEGFLAAYATALNCREYLLTDEICSDLRCEYRVLVHSTDYYARLLMFLSQKDIMSDGMLFEERLNLLSKKDASAIYHQKEITTALLDMEKQSIRKGYIPKVTIDCQKTDRLEQWIKQRLQELCTEKLLEQVKVISSVLSPRTVTDGSEAKALLRTSGRSVDKTALCQRIQRIAQSCLSRYDTLSENSNAYFFMADDKTEKYYLCTAVPFLADSLFGILPAMYAYSRIFSCAKTAKTADSISTSILQSIQATPPNTLTDGLRQGVGGLLWLSNLLCNMGVTEPFQEIQAHLVAHIPARKLSKSTYHNKTFSLLDGEAGNLLSLATLPDESKTSAVKVSEQVLAGHILENLANHLSTAECRTSDEINGMFLALMAAQEDLPGELHATVQKLRTKVLTDQVSSLGCGQILSLYCGYPTDVVEYSHNNSLRYGNGAMLIALEDNGAWNRAELLADIVTRQMLDSIGKQMQPMNEPSDYCFPSFFTGHGGILYALLRILDPSLPPVFV